MARVRLSETRVSYSSETARHVAEIVVQSYNDFSDKRARVDPGFPSRMRAGSGWKAVLSRIFAFVPVNMFAPKQRKFVFLSGRFDELMSTFNGAEAAMIGTGASDRAFARKTGLPFLFAGDLFVAVSAILFKMRGVPARWVIDRWVAWFSRQADPCFLVVPNDTMPIALLLVTIARRCRNVRVICLQHGLFNSVYVHDDIEGRNSDLNLVYCESQRQEMERRIPRATVEVMGFPAVIPLSDPELPPNPVAILVGAGTFEDLTNYKQSLVVFREAEGILKHAGARVEYRPHPSEKGLRLADSSFSVTRTPKRELLSGERKIFIGFTSTLLYEASLAGHLVFILNDSLLPGYTISDFGVRLGSGSLVDLPRLIQLGKRRVVPASAPTGELRSRFEEAINLAVRRLVVARNQPAFSSQKAEPESHQSHTS